MNENLDIFIFAHKDFEKKPTNECYKLVSIEDFETETNLEHIICDVSKDEILKKEHGYSELARLHYIWKNYKLKDYIGTAHYRRYFEFFNNIPNMDEIFKTYDAILPNFNLGWPNVYSNYNSCHDNTDIMLVLNIICKKYNKFFKSAIDIMAGDLFYPCNLFVLPKNTFIQWCNFVFGVLEEYDKIMGFKTDNDIKKHVLNNPRYTENKGEQNGNSDYQSRIEAFLSERLSTIFLHEKIKNPLMLNMILTEYHYDYEIEYYNYKEI